MNIEKLSESLKEWLAKEAPGVAEDRDKAFKEATLVKLANAIRAGYDCHISDDPDYPYNIVFSGRKAWQAQND